MWIYLLIGYFVIGFLLGINNLSSGKVGTAGPLATIAAHVLLWPLFLFIK